MQTIEILLDAIKSLSLVGDMAAVTGIVKTAARKLLNADGATFILRENDLCYYADEDAISPLWKGKRFVMESCISGWVMQNRKSAVIGDIDKDKRVPVDVYQPTFVKSLAMVPIRSANPLGAIGIYWAHNYTASPRELELLQSLADSTAVAIENIQVIDKLKKQNEAIAVKVDELKRANLKLEAETVLRNQLQKELFESNVLYHTTLCSVGDAVISTDVEGHIVFMNAVAEQLTGWPLTDAKGKPLTEVFHIVNLQTRKTCKNPVEIVLQKGEVVGLANHTTLISKDGHEYIITDSGSPIRNENGEITGTVLVFKEDTETHRKAEKIKSFNRIFEESLNEIYIFDALSLHFVFANKGALKNIGFTLKELSKLTPVDIKPEYDKKSFLEELAPLADGTTATLVFETIHRRKNGSTYPVEIHHQKSTFDNKEVFVAITHDITERKLAEEALYDSAGMYSSILETAMDGFWLTDLQGRFLQVNERYCTMSGYTEQELLTMQVSDLESIETADDTAAHIKKVVMEGEDRFESKHRRKDGSIFDLDVSVQYQNYKGGQLVCFLHDITERKLAEEKIREKDIQFRKLSANLPDLIFQFTRRPDGTYLVPIASEGIRNIFGCTPEDVVDDFTPIGRVIHPDDAARVISDIEYSAEHLTYFTCEFRVQIPGKEIQWIFSRSTPEKLPDGSITWYGFNADITERKLAEEKLKALEQQSRTWLENSPACTKIVDLDFNLQFMSTAGIEDLKIDDITPYYGKPYPFHFYPESFKTKMTGNMKKAIETGQVITQEAPVVDINGNEIWFHSTIVPAKDDNGQIEYLIIVSLDTTERKQAEEELIKAKKKAEENTRELKKAQKTAKVGSWVWYIKENKLWWSDEMYRIFDIDKKTFTGELDKVIEKAIHPEDRKKVEQSNLSVINENKPFPVEYRILLKGDTVRYVHAEADEVVLDEKGNSKILTGIVKDVTDYKLIQNELILAKEKAEESDRLKSAFLANMSHEIRTPMNGILGFTSLLQEPHLTGEEQQEYIEIIKKSGDRMLNTVNDIIDISKIEAGQMTVTDSEVNVSEKLRNMYSFFKPEAEKKGIQISLNNSLSEQKSIIQTDKEKLNSILTNLIKNAIKYTDKGSIEIGYKIVTTEHAPSLQFYVKDTGVGISDERQEAIFERFIQADIEDKMARQGSGLGLAITKAYVEMLGGEIWVESKAGEGSTFFFTLPLSAKVSEKTVEKETSIPDEKSNQRKDLNILIAEDDETSALYLQTILNNGNNKIVLTKNGHETVEVCRNKPDIDLVLMDIQMPGMNGYNATRKIRTFNKKVVIIAQTAYALEGDNGKALEAGCNDYISKPVKKDELLALIQKYFKK